MLPCRELCCTKYDTVLFYILQRGGKHMYVAFCVRLLLQKLIVWWLYVYLDVANAVLCVRFRECFNALVFRVALPPPSDGNHSLDVPVAACSWSQRILLSLLLDASRTCCCIWKPLFFVRAKWQRLPCQVSLHYSRAASSVLCMLHCSRF